MTRLSVIVPCHNVEAYAADTLVSLARSRDPGIEFLLVDDGSTDATAAVLAEHAEPLERVRILRHDGNRGLAAARNTGLDAATGEYIAFLDGDDWVEPGYYPTAAAHRRAAGLRHAAHRPRQGARPQAHRPPDRPRAAGRGDVAP